MKLHPDRNKDDPDAQAKFQELHKAYTTLSDREKRQIYDQVGQDQYERMESAGGAGAWDQGGNIPNAEDIFRHFQDIFGGFGDAFFTQRGFGGFRGMTITNITLSFMEAVHGVRKQVRLPNGKKIEVNIPAGIDHGQAIQVEDQAILAIEVKPHRYFRRDGLDIICETSVDIVEAILGGRVVVPSLSGDTEVYLQAGTQHGDRLRLSGKGVRPERGRSGDQYIVIRVVIPRKVTARQRQLLLEFAEEEQSKKAA
ncbi:unnamed protein product [Ostreobium quekettii]|uniref:J domain-containing protein n=1 Tax=Ostreobium quekettii TaxID=121088 RepID=A0A8S1JBY5_9CHLO|nr:unnamed protein product [Ostreobium quekettii]